MVSLVDEKSQPFSQHETQLKLLFYDEEPNLNFMFVGKPALKWVLVGRQSILISALIVLYSLDNLRQRF